MKYKFHTVSSEAWDAMLVAIKVAQKSIYWECYILLDDTPTHNFFQILKEKARQGVRVKIIADAVGSFWLGAKAINELTIAGVEILFFNHLVPWWSADGRIRRFRHWWFNRNHKKILIIDEEVGFIGGVNIAKQFAHWLDLHVELRGLIVRGLTRSFAKSYKICGGRDDLLLRMANSKWRIARKGKLQILEHWPFRRPFLRKYYLQHLNNAKREITIATPYFIPHWWLVKSLEKASDRGIKIDIILPEKADHSVSTWANHIFTLLVKEKIPSINFYFTNQMIHAKILLVDDSEGLIGSNNIDARSFDYNTEGGLVFQHKNMLSDLKKIIEKWKESSRILILNKSKKSWQRKFLEILFTALQPLL